jgi:hypothetical protein
MQNPRISFRLSVALALLGCHGAPYEPPRAAAPVVAPAPASVAAAPDPDLHRPPRVPRLAIDWSQVSVASDAEATALWQRIAPTGADWDDKLPEVPAAFARPLATALLRAGNFTCAVPPAGPCARPSYDEPPPAPTAGLGDPCLRRVLALWAIDQLDSQLDDHDLPAVLPALTAIAAIPPPESQLVEAALRAIPRDDLDARLAVLASAWRAGQHDLVNGALGGLDEPHLIEAVRRHHIAGALEVLAVDDARATYLAAVTDEALDAGTRTMAITELATLATADGKPALDLRAALRAAVGSKDCEVAARAARVLDQQGDHRFVPKRRPASTLAAQLREICVLASYEALQHGDEASLLATYLPARGLERITITYDPMSDDDPDGDGDPHTTHSAELVPRADAVLPELDDLIHALHHCTGAICVSDEHEFRFVWTRAGELSRIEIADRPPCNPAHP